MTKHSSSRTGARRRITKLRHLSQFGLKSLLCMTFLASLFGYWLYLAECQKKAISVIENSGGIVTYAHQEGNQNPPAPEWLRKLLGNHSVMRVTGISFANNGNSPLNAKSFDVISTFDDVERLGLANVGIKDLSVLADLRKLKYLELSRNRNLDLSPLSNLKDLETLLIDEARIDNLEPLRQMTKLKTLSVRSSRVRDLSPMTGMNGLTELTISSNELTDISPLSNLKCLRELNICGPNSVDISPIASLTQLEMLEMEGFAGTDFSMFASMPNLKILVINDFDVTSPDLGPFRNLHQLSTIKIHKTNATNILALSKLQNLARVKLIDAKVDPQEVSRLRLLLPKCNIFWVNFHYRDSPKIKLQTED